MKKRSKKKLKKRLRKAKKKALRQQMFAAEIKQVAKDQPVEVLPALELTEQELSPVLEGHDENALARAKTHWFFGEWHQLAALDMDSLHAHPDRDRFALLTASAHQQLGDHDNARKYTRMALDWGCPPRVVAQVLIAGVHNTLGRASVLKQDEVRIVRHFEASVAAIGTRDTALMSHARSVREMARMGLLPQAATLVDQQFQVAPEAKQSLSQQEARKKELKMEIDLLMCKLSLDPQHCQIVNKDLVSTSPKIKVFGAFRTGTNYLRALIEWNYPVEVVYNTIGGWKHGVVTSEYLDVLYENNLHCIGVVKDPLATLRSIYNYYVSAGLNIRASKEWPDFLYSRFIIFDSGRNKRRTEYRYANPVEYWNAMTWSILAGAVKNPDIFMLIKYEDLLIDPVNTIEKVMKKFGLISLSVNKEFKVPQKTLMRMGDGARKNKESYITNELFDGAYYLNNKFKDFYSPSDIDFVKSVLDEELLCEVAYTVNHE